MLSTYKYMDFVTAVNEPMEPASTCAPHTKTQDILWTSMFHIQDGIIETIDYTKIGTSCTYIFVQSVQESHRRPQHNNKCVQPMDRFIHCIHINTGSTKQMEGSCRQQSCFHSRRNIISFMEISAISIQSCWSHLKRKWTYNTAKTHSMVKGITMAFTGAI